MHAVDHFVHLMRVISSGLFCKYMNSLWVYFFFISTFLQPPKVGLCVFTSIPGNIIILNTPANIFPLHHMGLTLVHLHSTHQSEVTCCICMIKLPAGNVHFLFCHIKINTFCFGYQTWVCIYAFHSKGYFYYIGSELNKYIIFSHTGRDV